MFISKTMMRQVIFYKYCVHGVIVGIKSRKDVLKRAVRRTCSSLAYIDKSTFYEKELWRPL